MSEGHEQPRAFDLRDYVDFDLQNPAGRRVLETDVLAVDVLCLEPGQAVHARSFPTADAVYTVLGGMAWLVTDEIQVTLEALQAAVVPAGVPHGIRNNAADPLIVHVVTSPPDEVPVAAGTPRPAPPPRAKSAPAGRRLIERLRRGLGG